MSNIIVKLADNKYVEWTSVCDAPSSSVMDKAEMEAYVRRTEERRHELESDDETIVELRRKLIEAQISSRLERIEKNGTSSLIRQNVESLIACNRAGRNEERLSITEIIELYTYDESKKGLWPWYT